MAKRCKIGDALRWVREELGLERSQMADDCGISVRQLRSYESGKESPNWGTILKIINAVGVAWLIGLLEEIRSDTGGINDDKE